MANYPPPPDQYPQHDSGSQQNDYSNSHQYHRQPLHLQANNRENISWNNMNDKYNRYSQTEMHHNNYHSGPPHSQRYDSYNDPRGNGNNSNNNTVKRASKRRVKHDLPGPAGNWFRLKKQQKSSANANRKAPVTSTSSGMKAEQSAKQQTDTTEKTEDCDENSDSKHIFSSSTNNKSAKPQDEQLFHDHSSDLHECNAWNLMCVTLGRIVPPANLLLHNHPSKAAYSLYKSTLRKSIPTNYALIHEILEGRYDTCHLEKDLYSSDLKVPLLVGYVASVQCHAHSDWTALLVDEMHSVAKYSGGNSSSSNVHVGRGILCWIEERLVKQHANWIRPGAVWMVEGATLALFSSLEDEDNESHQHYYNGSSSSNSDDSNAVLSTSMTDMSPSTDSSRSGASIDRMLLVGESSMVYAWTPEEASSTFTHQEFSDLMERRCDLGLQGEELLAEDAKEGGFDECEVGHDSLKSDFTKEQSKVIDGTLADSSLGVAEQVLEACTAAKFETKQIESLDENTTCLPQVVEGEPKDVAHAPVQNLPNPYAKKNLSQVTPHEEITTKSPNEEMLPDEKDSSVLVQSGEKILSPSKDALNYSSCEKKDSNRPTTIDNARTSQLQHSQKVDSDDDDMLDDDSLDEVLCLKNKVEPEGTAKKNASTEVDSLDEDSLDITPISKLDSKLNTHGSDSYDDMLDEDSLGIDTPNVGKARFETSTPGDESFNDMLDDDSDNLEAMFQTKNPLPAPNKLFSLADGVLDKDDLADLGEEDDDDF